MPRPWQLLDSVDTEEGRLELRKRGERDFMISIAGRVLMTSMLTRSELAVAELGCDPIVDRERPRVLIGGLGLGFTLRAALDCLPRSATVVVAEITPRIVDWCRGPLASLTDDALADPRVEVVVGDVTDRIREASRRGADKFDAIVFDLYVGPGEGKNERKHPLYGSEILRRTVDALTPGGSYAVWGEGRDRAFEDRMERAGFRTEYVRKGPKGALKHSVYLARKK